MEENIMRDGFHIKITYYLKHRINDIFFLKNNKLHRDDGKPAYIKFDLDGSIIIKIYYVNGHCHRGDDKPAYIKYTSEGNILEVKYFIDGKMMRLEDDPTHIIYYKNSGKVKYEKYKSDLYRTYIFYNSNLPMNIIVDNNLIHRVNGPGLTRYFKSGIKNIEIYFHKGKIHRYEGYAKIIYDKNGEIVTQHEFINNYVCINNEQKIKNWSKMFAKNIA